MFGRLQPTLGAFLLLTMTGLVAQSSSVELDNNLARLSSLEYPVRMNAARAIRRLPQEQAVPALVQAVRKHKDEFVRYRAFILLSSFNDRGTADLVRDLLHDANDRLREAAYKWLEVHPDSGMVPTLLSALQTEQAEFVRPALVSALAAVGDDTRVQRALLVEINRGLDFFRGAVIDALGRRRAEYAVDQIAAVARLQGPLQDDAVIALGRIGGRKALAALAALAAESTPADLSLTIRAAQCMAGERCDASLKAITDAVTASGPSAAVVRAGVTGLSAVAAIGNQEATSALVALGQRGGVLREHAAVGLGSVAVLNPEYALGWRDRAQPQTRDQALMLLKDGFDDLEEDFGEEQFFAAARATYWKAPDGSDTRSLAAAIIQRLEF